MSENPRKDKVTEPITPTASAPDGLVEDLDVKLSEEEQQKVTGGQVKIAAKWADDWTL